MSTGKWVGIVLIVLGVLALIYGGFSYTQRSEAAKVGPIQVNVQHRHTVAVPIWAGIGVIVLGGIVLALGDRRS